ncbi:MAG TPA: hypothetical protein VLV81_01795 [Acidimicrobiia bacterium]|nr:hypothetical protein [Acidimicrobiia bacterium]
MSTTSARERERALAWIASQLRWEQTLAGLRGAEPHVEECQAA